MSQLWTAPSEDTTTVTASYKYDVQANTAWGKEPGYVQWDGRYTKCDPGPRDPNNAEEICVIYRYPVEIAIPGGGRGAIPLEPADQLQYTVDLSPDTVYGDGAMDFLRTRTGLDDDEILRRYGARFIECAGNNPYGGPATRAGNTTNAVRNSGQYI